MWRLLQDAQRPANQSDQDNSLCHRDGKSMSAKLSASLNTLRIDGWNRQPYMRAHELAVDEHFCVSSPPPSWGGTAARSRVSSRAAGFRGRHLEVSSVLIICPAVSGLTPS
jgi:hypothetical protein